MENEADEKVVQELREQMLDSICKELKLPKSFFDEPEPTTAVECAEYEEKQRLFMRGIANRQITLYMAVEKSKIETYGVFKHFDLIVPESYSYQEYLKKLTDEELKNHITIYSIINLGTDIPDDLQNFDSEVFKEIKIIHCTKTPAGKQLRGFIDDRHFGNEDYEVYKPYLEMSVEK